MLARRALCRLALLAAAVCAACPAAFAADAIFFRIFLRDGSTLVSYGEFSRVADDVVLSLPIGGDDAAPRLQLVTVPAAAVDWERTDAYAESARARHFADTQGEKAFGALSEEVARTLNSVAFGLDPAARLASVERAQRMLAAWPAAHYGYRAADVAELSSLLDEVVSQMRVEAGLSRFNVSLVATTDPPPSVPLLPPPTLSESVEQAFRLARQAPDPVQRRSLLQAVQEALAGPAASGGWAAALRARAGAELAQMARVDEAYASLTRRVLDDAERRLQRADVGGIESLLRRVLKTDDRLGRQRPRETAALLQTLDLRLAQARERRLALDRQEVERKIARAYEKQARDALGVLRRSRSSLEQIQRLAGPSPGALQRLEKESLAGSRLFSLIRPAPEVQAVHSLITSALQMTVRAAATRTRAITANDMTLAWQASSAAAGALLLVDRARDELDRLTSPPRP